ncbi:MAG: hypothetical protein WEK74_02360 [Hydrogenophaga sp.]
MRSFQCTDTLKFDRLSRLTRRRWLGAAAAGLTLVPAWPAAAQSVSAAAEETKAPALPALGSLLAGADGRLVFAEKGQMFAVNAEASAQLS